MIKVLFSLFTFFLTLFLAPCVRSQLVWQTEYSTGFTPRYASTSAVVDGKIYVMGGGNDSDYIVNTFEVFDPQTNTWSTPITKGTSAPRNGATSVVANGKIYLIGGYADTNGIFPYAMDVFDPSTNTWSTPVTTGTFTPRGSLTSVVMGGKIYVMCGFDGNIPLNTVEVFDPDSNTWSTPVTFGVLTPRIQTSAAAVGSKIYVIDGYREAGPLDLVQVFDTSTNTWSTLPTSGVSTRRNDHSSAVVDSKIYVIGGDVYTGTPVEVFDPASNQWSSPLTTGTFTPRSKMACSEAFGSIYAIGGVDDSGNGNVTNANEALTFGAGLVAEGSMGCSLIVSSYPNPLTDRTTISFDLPERGDVTVEIHDQLGRLISTLANEEMVAGPHELTWQPGLIAAGSYVCTLKSVRLNLMERCKLALMR